ncbi:hypothetical protein [Sphingomonas sp. TWP1-3-1]|uniref:hypothetical protein n=1 Tax=Sphingomonas sp. TWP1-3-1 TaxID=2804612 RepID=UPI003CF62694
MDNLAEQARCCAFGNSHSLPHGKRLALPLLRRALAPVFDPARTGDFRVADQRYAAKVPKN